MHVCGMSCFVTLTYSLETWSLTKPGCDQVPATLTALLHIALALQMCTASSSSLGGCWGFELGSLLVQQALLPIKPSPRSPSHHVLIDREPHNSV